MSFLVFFFSCLLDRILDCHPVYCYLVWSFLYDYLIFRKYLVAYVSHRHYICVVIVV